IDTGAEQNPFECIDSDVRDSASIEIAGCGDDEVVKDQSKTVEVYSLDDKDVMAGNNMYNEHISTEIDELGWGGTNVEHTVFRGSTASTDEIMRNSIRAQH